MTLPFAGHPCGAPSAKEAKNDLDKSNPPTDSSRGFVPLRQKRPHPTRARRHQRIDRALRNRDLLVRLPGASLVQSDEFYVGDAASEKSHDYNSPDASAPYEINVRYELASII
jgi:hypothetical protein